MTTIIRSRRRITDDRCYFGVRRPPRLNSRERPLSLPEDRQEETEGPPPQRGPSAARILNRSRVRRVSPNGDTSSGNEDTEDGHGCKRAARDGQGARRRGQGDP